MNTTPNPAGQTEEEKKRRALLPLLLLLLFLLLATSCIAGFLLGRTTDPDRLGALIDTIVLTPDSQVGPNPSPMPAPSAGENSEGRITLVGLVRSADGVPFTQGSVQLRNGARLSQLDGEGRFRFDGVELGEYEVGVLDQSGNLLASRIIRVTPDAGRNSYAEYEGAVCVLHVKVLTVEVSVELTMEDTPGGALEVALVDAWEAERPAPRPSLPPPAASIAPSTAQPTAEPDGTPVPSSAVTPTAEPTAGPSATPLPTPSVTPAPTPSAAPTPSPSREPVVWPTTGPAVPPAVGPTARPTASPTPTPEDTQAVEVSHGDSPVAWTQQAEIDLFRPLNGSDRRLIAPGATGYYLFQLENGRQGKVCFTLAVREGAFHVPLEYRLTDDRTGRELSPWQSASTQAETVSRTLELDGKKAGAYRIEWRWPFQGNDAADTALGARGDRTYTLKLTIRVEDAI